MRRITQPVINVVTLALLGGGLVWGLPKVVNIGQIVSVPEQAIETLSTVGLSVEQVTVEGRINTQPEELLAALGAEHGTPILEIDIPQALQQVTALPWVKSAMIVRRLPNRLHITLEEHLAFAVWQQDGRYSLIAADGAVIRGISELPSDMMVVVGDDAPAHAAALHDVLSSQPQLHIRVKAAVRHGQRRWDIILDAFEGGVTVKLPEKDIGAAWDGLAVLHAKHGLLDSAIAELDLRIPGRLVVRLLHGYEPVSSTTKHSPNTKGVRQGTEPLKNREGLKGV